VDEAAHHRQAARDRTALDLGRAGGEIGPEIRGEQITEGRQARRLAEMQRQEIEEGGEVAAIGGDRVRRGAALASEPGSPQFDRGAQILGGRKPRQRHGLGQGGKALH